MLGRSTLFPLIFTLFALSHATLPYQLSPSVPPVAFLDQPYTCQFIVPGLTSPIFTFRDLPSFLTIDSNGALVGTPSSVGAYPFTVIFESGRSAWQQDVVLRVLQPSVDGVPQLTSSLPRHSYAGRCTYRVGEQVLLDLSGLVDDSLVTWSYLNLPSNLVGNRAGLVKGRFLTDGYYSFGAVCADQFGSVLDYFFTLNVQANAYGTILATVPRRNPTRYSIIDLAAIHHEAISNIQVAFNLVATLREEVARLAVVVEATIQDLDLSDTQAVNVQKLVSVVVSKRIKLINLLNKAQASLKRAGDHYELHKTIFEQAKITAESAREQLASAQATFDRLNSILEEANDDYTDAKNGVKSATIRLETARIMIADAHEDISSSFEDIINGKRALQDANYELKRTDLDVDNAHIAREEAELENDHATSNLHKADKQVEKALKNLAKADGDVGYLRGRANDASKYLGAAKYNLNQAMNRLIVAQAAKEQSDKAIAILSAQQASLSILEGETTYIFSTCEPGPYPSMSGSAKVITASAHGYQLDSGYTLIYGACSRTVACSVGDVITYDGYLKDGFIHGIDISKE